VLNLIYLLEFVNQGKPRDKEYIYLNLQLIAKELNSFLLILLHIKDIEIDISEVDNK
jgi:hypothetical protein